MNKEKLLELAASYRKIHEQSGFGVDDPVVITRAATTLEQGWCAGWLPAMDKYVGKTGVIVRDNKEVGFFIEFDDGTSYHFPFFILEKGKIEEEVVIELPFLKGRYYATESQEDALIKNLEDVKDSTLGNVPWLVVDAEGNIIRNAMNEPCLGSLHSSGTRRIPKLNKNPVLFLRWNARYATSGGMTKAQILDYHEYLKDFSPWTKYIVHFNNKKLNEHFFGIRLKDVPANLPLMLGTHARMPWDSYQSNVSYEYHELEKEAPKASPGELLVVSSMLQAQGDGRKGKNLMFSIRVKSGGHAMWGGEADPHVFKEYLDGELDKRRYDTDSFKMYSGHGMGVENPFSIKVSKIKDSINTFLEQAVYPGKSKVSYGERYIFHLTTPQDRLDNLHYLLKIIKGL